MFITHDEEQLADTMRRAVEASPEHPVLLDRFLEDAYEVDVDVVADGERVVIAGVMQHIEEAGIHSGDSACVIPPYHRAVIDHLDTIREYTRKLALALEVRGLMNVQYAIKGGTVYVLEVNPRASRTVPFVAKATGVPLAGIAAKVMVGASLSDLGLESEPVPKGYFVKEAVLPFTRFPKEDPILGPEMRSTGEVMGVGQSFGQAFANAQLGEGCVIPETGSVFVSVNDSDKDNVVPIARAFADLGFRLTATSGTAKHLRECGLEVAPVFKVLEGRPNAVDRIKNGEIVIVVNTPFGRESYFDEKALRTTATQRRIPLITTLSGAAAMVEAIRAIRSGAFECRSLQELYPETARSGTAESS
jgi:carbamoyl-phosphate synthase large subunit